MSTRKALFLDRDGVVNIDRGYIHRQDQVEFTDGIFDLCRYASNRDYLIFVVTNQSGIGRGYYTEPDFLKLSDWMNNIFISEGCPIARFYYCPYHPDLGIGRYKRNSDMRKPGPGMILKAKAEYGLDLTASTLVGDNESDIEAGKAAGIGCNILFNAVSDTRMPTVNNVRVVSRLIEIKEFL